MKKFIKKIVENSEKYGDFFYDFLVDFRTFLIYWSKLCLVEIPFALGFSHMSHILIHFTILIVKCTCLQINS